MIRIFITALLLGSLSHFAVAQHFDKSRLDSFFTALEVNDKFMGSVAVTKNGQPLYSRTIGFSDVENNVKAGDKTTYRIGSISKTFTAVLILKAVEENKLSLDQTIDKFFPAIKNGKQITIQHLLHHRSGIHNFTNDQDYLTWNTQPKSEMEMIEIISRAGSDFEPGSRAAYSNSNFVLLTYILEKTFGKPYAELLDQYIVKPLGLQHTYFGKKNNANKMDSKSYTYSGGWKPVPATDISIPLGAGGIISTPGDLATFSDALFGGKLLTKQSLDVMKTIKDGYGAGLVQIPFYDKKGYGHTGGIDGFSSVFFNFADDGISYALTSNGSNYINNNISIAVLSAVYGKPFDIPEFSTYAVRPEDLDLYLGVYVSQQVPLNITVTKDDNTLIAQATGQPAFPLEPTGKDKFKYTLSGLVLEFNPAEKGMVLKQGGTQFLFTKE